MDYMPLTPLTMESSTESPGFSNKDNADKTFLKNFEECFAQVPESELRSHRLEVFNEKF